MTESLVIDLPDGEAIEVGNAEWMEISSAKWNRLEDGGYAQWTEAVLRHADGRILVYVIYLPSSGILQTVGEILPAGTREVSELITRLAERFDVPSNVPHACIDGFEQYAREFRR
jgi:hypothetical protein